MKTVEEQTNEELAARLVHNCQPTCTAENCDAQQAAKRLRGRSAQEPRIAWWSRELGKYVLVEPCALEKTPG